MVGWLDITSLQHDYDSHSTQSSLQQQQQQQRRRQHTIHNQQHTIHLHQHTSA